MYDQYVYVTLLVLLRSAYRTLRLEAQFFLRSRDNSLLESFLERLLGAGLDKLNRPSLS